MLTDYSQVATTINNVKTKCEIPPIFETTINFALLTSVKHHIFSLHPVSLLLLPPLLAHLTLSLPTVAISLRPISLLKAVSPQRPLFIAMFFLLTPLETHAGYASTNDGSLSPINCSQVVPPSNFTGG